MSMLMGPHADDAYDIIESALTLTRDEALALSCAYEDDPNEHYLAHCAMVADALALTGRTVESGWLETVFQFQDWTADTKALHAVADAVMAGLVADVVPAETVYYLSRPWIRSAVTRETLVAGPV